MVACILGTDNKIVWLFKCCISSSDNISHSISNKMPPKVEKTRPAETEHKVMIINDIYISKSYLLKEEKKNGLAKIKSEEPEKEQFGAEEHEVIASYKIFI